MSSRPMSKCEEMLCVCVCVFFFIISCFLTPSFLSRISHSLSPSSLTPSRSFSSINRYGFDVSVHQGVAVVGAPNRDSFVSGLNTGAAFLYTFSSFLDFRFVEETIRTEEDHENTTQVEVRRCDPHCLESAVLCEDMGGLPMHGVCWILGAEGDSCADTCRDRGVSTPNPSTYTSFIMKDLLGSEWNNNVQSGQTPMGPYECFWDGSNVHAAHDRDVNSLPAHQHDTWSHTHCALACPCAFSDAIPDSVIGLDDVNEPESLSYDEMSEICLGNHMRLCSSTELCNWLQDEEGMQNVWKHEHDTTSMQMWVPVSDGLDNWLCTSALGCDSINRCDAPSTSEPAENVNTTTRRVMCCGALYPPPTTTSDQMYVRYSTSDALNSDYQLDEAISRENPTYLPQGSASARKDCVSSSFSEDKDPMSCRWTKERTQYDWKGQGDYAPESSELRFGPYDVAKRFDVHITNDDVTELPSEYAHLRLHKPGTRPSYFGEKWSVLEIQSDDDGIVGTRSYGHVLYESDLPGTEGKNFVVVGSNSDHGVLTSRRNDAFGSAVTQDNDFVFVGTPGRSNVYISKNSFGVWEETQILSPSFEFSVPKHLARFGEAVAADSGTLFVSAPGLSTAFVYRRTNDFYNLVVELPCPVGLSPSNRYGSAHALALHNDYAVIGAYGIESVFVYRRQDSYNHSSWILSQTLYPTKQMGARNRIGIHTVRRAEFGCSVAIQDFTIVVGARREIVLNETLATENLDELFHSGIDFDAIGSVYIFDARSQEFDLDSTLHSNTSVIFTKTTRLSPTSVSGSSRHLNSLFGSSVAIDGNTLVISAQGDRAHADCTWNFETGNVNGWTRTGTAFNNQPVFGDNTLYRPVHHGRFHGRDGIVYTERQLYDPVEIAGGVFSPYNQVHVYQRFEGFAPATQTEEYSFIYNVSVFRDNNMTLAECRDTCFYRHDACFGFTRPYPKLPEDATECKFCDGVS